MFRQRPSGRFGGRASLKELYEFKYCGAIQAERVTQLSQTYIET